MWVGGCIAFWLTRAPDAGTVVQQDHPQRVLRLLSPGSRGRALSAALGGAKLVLFVVDGSCFEVRAFSAGLRLCRLFSSAMPN